jgi:hypothetical protein
MLFHRVQVVAAWLMPVTAIALGTVTASAHPAAAASPHPAGARAATPPPRLMALSYGLFQPPGAPQPSPALRLTARQANGQIINIAFQEVRNDVGNGIGGDVSDRCGIPGRRTGGLEISYLPLAETLTGGTHHIRVVAYGSACRKGSGVTSSARTFTVRVKS